MKVLVTGGAGFIGSHLTRALLASGHEVRVVDNYATGLRWRLDEVRDSIEVIEGDVADPSTSAEAVKGIEVVLHQAAIPSVARSVDDPVRSNHANLTGTITLLQACRVEGVRRLVFAASSSAYGTSPSLPKVETMEPKPLSPYAVSKLGCELYCQVFANLGFLETVCLRYFNIFGPMQDPKSHYAAVIPKFATSLLNDEPIPLNGDGSQSRDFTYVDNAVQANLKAMTAPDISGQVINIGCGARYDLLHLIRTLGEIIGREPRIEFNAGRPGDVPHSLADITKARTLLGYAPTVEFAEGVRRTVEWLRNESPKYFGPLKGA